MKKNTLVMLVILVVLLLVVLVLENPFGGSEKKAVSPLFPGLDSAAVAVVEVYSPSDSTRLEKVDGIWRVATQGGYPADAQAVGEILAKVCDMGRDEVASRNPEKQSIFQVDGSNIEVRFLGADDNVFAHFYVGKSGPGHSGAYVRSVDSDNVILARGYLRGVFDKGARGWRDREIVDVNQNEILRFTMAHGDTVITVRTDDKIRWYITEPDSVEARMNTTDNVLRAFSTLMADDFGPDVSLEDAGLDQPWGTFTAHLADGTDLVLLVGSEEAGSRWVKGSDKDMVFKIRQHRVDSLFPPLDRLREPTPVPTK
ncbi:MAG: DUF4340 domain-containing protein [Candidatus Eisenbacteria sp.]|nr:DUF4340 domain-containing protein [Candidatus Eisenbacteria bacterium]